MKRCLIVTLCVVVAGRLEAQGRRAAPKKAPGPGPVIARVAPEHGYFLLRLLLASPNPVHRRAAIPGLACLGSKGAVRSLVRALEDPDRRTSDAARKALASLGGRHDSVVMRAVHGGLSKAGPRAVQARVDIILSLRRGRTIVRNLLTSHRQDLRLAALQALTRQLEARDADDVLDLLRDDSRRIRKQACIAVGRLGSHAALPALVDLLEDPDAGVVANATWALRRISGLKLGPNPELWRTWLSNHPEFE